MPFRFEPEIAIVEVTLSDGRVLRVSRTSHLISGDDAFVASFKTWPDEWTLDGKPISEDEARAIVVTEMEAK